MDRIFKDAHFDCEIEAICENFKKNGKTEPGERDIIIRRLFEGTGNQYKSMPETVREIDRELALRLEEVVARISVWLDQN